MLLFERNTSAYHAKLASDGESFILTTDGSAFRLVPGARAEALPSPPDAEAVWSPAGFVAWVDGAIDRVDHRTGRRERAVTLKERPRALAAWHHDVAWIERPSRGTSLIGSSSAREPVYRSPGTIEAVTMLSDWVFFVERLADVNWRIGGVPSTGGQPRFTEARPGRTPAMLVSSDEGLYYYDGNAREVRRSSLDLQEETVVGRGDVCSPLAVAGNVFCARIGGIVELVPDEPPRQLVMAGAGRLVTAMAATPRHVAWVSEAGAERLEVHSLERTGNRGVP